MSEKERKRGKKGAERRESGNGQKWAIWREKMRNGGWRNSSCHPLSSTAQRLASVS